MKQIINAIRSKFGEKAEILERSSKRIYVRIDSENIKEIISLLYKDMNARFSIASGIDNPGYFEILYHMAFDQNALFVTVKTQISKKEPEIESITDIVPGAEWIEREMHELLGIKFKGHPNLARLLLPDDWPDEEYPLRKSYPQMRRK